jgi:uncharacterized protein (AIM24 family)
MDVDQFTSVHEPTDTDETFQTENSYTLDITVDGTVMVKAGSMVGYTGDITFTGKSSAEGGVTGLIKEAVTSEGTPVMEAEGDGHLYVADQGKKVRTLDLSTDESVSLNGDDILAFESRVDYEVGTIDSISGAVSGGLTNVYLTGPGTVALSTHGDPLVLTPPVKTDPNATVAWDGDLSPSVAMNKTFEVGQTSEEGVQMEFTDSDGFVVVQPYEENGQRQ